MTAVTRNNQTERKLCDYKIIILNFNEFSFFDLLLLVGCLLAFNFFPAGASEERKKKKSARTDEIEPA